MGDFLLMKKKKYSVGIVFNNSDGLKKFLQAYLEMRDNYKKNAWIEITATPDAFSATVHSSDLYTIFDLGQLFGKISK